jgi:hypothetical protein
MISDVLFEAQESIKEYLKHPATKGCYTGKMLESIIDLLNKMSAIQTILDLPPNFGKTKGESNGK